MSQCTITYPDNDQANSAEHSSRGIDIILEDGSSCNQGDDACENEELGWPIDGIGATQVVGCSIAPHGEYACGKSNDANERGQGEEDGVLHTRCQVGTGAASRALDGCFAYKSRGNNSQALREQQRIWNDA